jgi:4-hydroxybenzoate polyprenyltransferase
MKDAPPLRPADAVAGSWVGRMPASLRPYLELARLDRPVGTWLLLWPCWWSLLLAASQSAPDWPRLFWYAALFALGAVVMRSAGCAFNDIADADLDAKVSRTAGRPIPSGRLSPRAAWLFVAALCFIGLAVLLQFQPLAIGVGMAALLLVAAYPFMKRITWWPQAWLGLTFNWGALVGWAAWSDTISAPALLLYAAGAAWTLGYDTIYALQDVEDDALAGVKSSARRLGDKAGAAITLFYLLAACLAASAAVLLWGGWGVLAVLPFAGHLGLQASKLRPQDPDQALRLFRANRDAGGLLTLGLFGLLMLGWLR